MDIGLAVGGAFLSSALNVLFDRLAPNGDLLNMFKRDKRDVRLLKKLRMTLLGLQAVLSDAENKQASNPYVNQWLNELQDAVEGAENLIEEVNYEVLRLKVEGQHQNLGETSNQQHYYHDPSDKTTLVPTKFFKFLNCAAFITEGDTRPDGSISNPWRLCTVQQVEDLKSLIKLFPLWASGLLLSIQLVMQFSLLILQALKMDRHMGPHFEIPAGSMLVFILLFTCIAISIIDRLLNPFLAKYTRFALTPLQRVGIGHILTIACMVVSALVESRRLRVARSHHLQGQKDGIVPMSVFWLLPQLVLSGIGEGFHFPGHITFYYQEFPTSLKNTSTAMVSLFIGIAFYLGNVLIDLVQRESGWLPDNINDGRMDNVFWLCCTLGSINFIYFLLVASFYKYKNMDNKPKDVPSK